MKKLLIDLGNTSLKWMLTDSGKMNDEGAFKHNDDFSTQILDDLPKCFDKVYLASVASTKVKDKLISIFKAKFALDIKEISSHFSCCGVTNSYKKVSDLGVDRWMACIAVKKEYPEEVVCILDLGSAITLDVVDENGQHKGGHILPGLNAAQSLLLKNTNLTLANNATIKAGLAKDTASAINSSYAMAISALVELQIKKEKVDRLVLTGSDADQISDFIMMKKVIKTSLVLNGLKIVSEID